MMTQMEDAVFSTPAVHIQAVFIIIVFTGQAGIDADNLSRFRRAYLPRFYPLNSR
jgi:hypothetical protein